VVEIAYAMAASIPAAQLAGPGRPKTRTPRTRKAAPGEPGTGQEEKRLDAVLPERMPACVGENVHQVVSHEQLG
jgi:hypothetical protein